MKDPNSMLNWYPKIKGLLIPQPKTIMVKVQDKHKTLFDIVEGRAFSNIEAIHEAAQSLGFPVFMRTERLSSKHEWNETCFVENEEALDGNIRQLVEASLECDIIGKPVEAIVFREYIKMHSTFKAFGGLPISKERRYFVDNGKVICHHPYWPEEAIQFWSWDDTKEPKLWKVLLHEMNREREDEIALLSKYALQVSKVLNGYWSVDFCLAQDGPWYLIDCAQGEVSWHPKCDKARRADPFDFPHLFTDQE